MKKQCCLNCKNCFEFEDYIRCWEEPGVEDHPFVIPISEAENHCCHNFKDKLDFRCSDCEFFESIGEKCMNIKNAKVLSNGKIILKDTTSNKKLCDLFQFTS